MQLEQIIFVLTFLKKEIYVKNSLIEFITLVQTILSV